MLTTENVNEDYAGDTNFYLICSYNCTFDVIQLMLEYGANFNIPGDYYYTPFHALCQNTLITCKVLRLAIINDADFNIEDLDRRTPFHTLCENKSLTLSSLKFAIINGANFNIEDDDGKTPFQIICKKKLFKLNLLCLVNVDLLSIDDLPFLACNKLIKIKNTRMLLLLQLLRYTICGPIILEEIMGQ
jgi:ankyrin repeat protein